MMEGIVRFRREFLRDGRCIGPVVSFVDMYEER